MFSGIYMFSKMTIFQKLFLFSGWRWFVETDAWRSGAVYPNYTDIVNVYNEIRTHAQFFPPR
jgi:hypothetical protein